MGADLRPMAWCRRLRPAKSRARRRTAPFSAGGRRRLASSQGKSQSISRRSSSVAVEAATAAVGTSTSSRRPRRASRRPRSSSRHRPSNCCRACTTSYSTATTSRSSSASPGCPRLTSGARQQPWPPPLKVAETSSTNLLEASSSSKRIHNARLQRIRIA